VTGVQVRTIEPKDINGKLYYTPSQFAHLTGVSETMIYRLLNKGNYFRKLRADYSYFARPLIPIEELVDYPWTGPGRYPYKEVSHFTEDGDRMPCFLCSTEGIGLCPNTKERMT
jgi:hypothetical protein